MSGNAAVDYGSGNISSIINALQEIGCDGQLVSDLEKLVGFEKIFSRE
jgi:imidazoleglycerol phosphate synthase glutamine amidotransferase subunit HisH